MLARSMCLAIPVGIRNAPHWLLVHKHNAVTQRGSSPHLTQRPNVRIIGLAPLVWESLMTLSIALGKGRFVCQDELTWSRIFPCYGRGEP